MATFSVLLALCAGKSPVTSEFPLQRPVTCSFDVFFHLCLERLSKQSWGWWFEMPSRSLWHHCNVSWNPTFMSSHYNSFKDRVPVDFIYGYPIFKWVAVTWQRWEGTEKVSPAISARWHLLLHLANIQDLAALRSPQYMKMDDSLNSLWLQSVRLPKDHLATTDKPWW